MRVYLGYNMGMDWGDIDFDYERGLLDVPGLPAIHLSPVESEMVAYVASVSPRLASRTELLREVWRYATTARSRTVDTTLGRVRRKLVGTGLELESERGRGVRLVNRRATQPAPPTPVPAAAPAPIGRASDLVRLERALTDGWVLLVGPPGVGKSTVARSWCAQVQGDRVDLAGVQRASALRRTLVTALGIASQDPEAGLVTRLADRVPLLLDNVDSLDADATTRLLGWLQVASAPVLLTARVAILPADRLLHLHELTDQDARQLVRQSRRSIGLPPLDPSREDRLLESFGGLPLALVVAAPVLDWLEDTRQALQIAVEDDRYEDLAAALEAALSRLVPHEVEVARALAAFWGAPDIHALAAVAALDTASTMSALTGLRRHGLVHPDNGEVVLLSAFRSVLRDGSRAQSKANGRFIDWLLHLPRSIVSLSPVAREVEWALQLATTEQRLDVLDVHLEIIDCIGSTDSLVPEADHWTADLPAALFADGAVTKAFAAYRHDFEVDDQLLEDAAPSVTNPARRALALALAGRGRSWRGDRAALPLLEEALATMPDDAAAWARLEVLLECGFAYQSLNHEGWRSCSQQLSALSTEAYPKLELYAWMLRISGENEISALDLERARVLLTRLRPHLCAHQWANLQLNVAITMVDCGRVEEGWDLVPDVLALQQAEYAAALMELLSNVAVRLVFETSKLEVLAPFVVGHQTPNLDAFLRVMMGQEAQLSDLHQRIYDALMHDEPLPDVTRGRLLRLGTGLEVAVRNRKRQARRG